MPNAGERLVRGIPFEEEDEHSCPTGLHDLNYPDEQTPGLVPLELILKSRTCYKILSKHLAYLYPSI